MADPRITRLAEILVDHSCQLKAGEKVLIEAFDLPDTSLVTTLVRLAEKRGAHPFVIWKNNEILRTLYQVGNETSIGVAGKWERNLMEQMQAYIGIRGAANTSELSDVDPEHMAQYQKLWLHEVHFAVRVPKTKWVVLRYPTASMAQSAKMSTEAFSDFYFNVCTTDYVQMAKNQQPLVRRMSETDQVRLKTPTTDITFSIKGIPIRPCYGQRNIPDGEVFTAPIRDSVNGVIRFNTPTLYQGTVFDEVELEFKNGKIIRAASGKQTDRLNKILDTDEGARYVGEWSIGCNNHVRHPMLDTLFDEKIGGSIHLTPGNAYDEADNGNRSVVHWDMVLIQTPEYGGGEIWFDGQLVRKEGRFTVPDLEPLNQGL